MDGIYGLELKLKLNDLVQLIDFVLADNKVTVEIVSDWSASTNWWHIFVCWVICVWLIGDFGVFFWKKTCFLKSYPFVDPDQSDTSLWIIFCHFPKFRYSDTHYTMIYLNNSAKLPMRYYRNLIMYNCLIFWNRFYMSTF